MAVTYGFFDSVQGDRVYDADDISNYFLKLISNGVFATPSNAMQVQANNGMTVGVTAGWGFINCKWINNSTTYLVTLDTPDVALPRIDRIVMRLDKSVGVRSIVITNKSGTPSANPQPPVLQRSGNVYELSLARIAVGADVSAITQADITDERPDTSVCGFVTGLIDQIDTTNLFAQFTNAFEAWFEAIRDEVQATNMIQGNRYRVQLDEDGELTDFEIPQSNYNYTLDVLHVYINGMLLTPGVDYTEGHDSQGTTTIMLIRTVDVIGTIVEYEVLKGVDVAGAQTVVSQVTQLRTDLNAILSRLNGLSFRKCTQAYYDSMASHDSNTLYLIVD